MSKTGTIKSRASGKATLAAVAALAGISAMTASRALNQPERVSDAVRERVGLAVAELGYVPNRAARAGVGAVERDRGAGAVALECGLYGRAGGD